ncbi:aminoglycoside phosphotransferase family protein [Streptomyces sp. NPDC001941]|uniref:aminoglycoside phosphotransferase family protein n=1 Tax=Streptomyces sp. NPDC001941 TaxID=3154659 RepID=UPI00331D6E0C
MIDIPEELVRTQIKYNGERGRAFVEALPELAAHHLARWGLEVTGPSMHGMASLVLPVAAADGTRAALKLQLPDEESETEGPGLRLWDGDGIVRLLDDDPDSGALLLERLDERRHLSDLEDVHEAVLVLAGLLARLVAVRAPDGMRRRLGPIAERMLADVPGALRALGDERERRVLRDCAAAVREVVAEPGDRLLHWDLHFDNVLAADREPWLAIDPKPLAGDPGFDLMPALDNRFDPADVRWRFDALTGELGLDRERARAWTLGRVLQNSLWDVEDGEEGLQEEQLLIAEVLLGRG